ncbi:MAG: hypothetical protein A2070_14350 [Bdellovibrionales bacterium GWC1_52_8]|nr:MAG: hypothetical protein A2X97_04720 [Bdellovibrionales bacterium GWA1_52_35]OFZ33758.1 MAG: hypothetical protein A2070_14350 [Bdellovibrionales bacterium GWC1_52_8]
MANRHLPDIWRREAAWNPVREISRLQRTLDRMFGDFMSPYEQSFGEDPLVFSPPCNLEETDKHFLFSFDLPGVSKDNVKIEVKDNQLIVSGERQEEETREKSARHATERFYGSFQRIFSLPSAVDAEKVQANYKDGVLRVALPKAAESKSKPIQITEGASESFEKMLIESDKKKEKAA